MNNSVNDHGQEINNGINRGTKGDQVIDEVGHHGIIGKPMGGKKTMMENMTAHTSLIWNFRNMMAGERSIPIINTR